VPIIGEKGKDSMCGKATKGTARRETGMSCEGRSIEKKVEEDKGRRDSACG